MQICVTSINPISQSSGCCPADAQLGAGSMQARVMAPMPFLTGRAPAGGIGQLRQCMYNAWAHLEFWLLCNSDTTTTLALGALLDRRRPVCRRLLSVSASSRFKVSCQSMISIAQHGSSPEAGCRKNEPQHAQHSEHPWRLRLPASTPIKASSLIAAQFQASPSPTQRRRKPRAIRSHHQYARG